MTQRVPRTIAAAVSAACLALGVGLAAAPAGAAAKPTPTKQAPTSGTTKIEVGDNFYDPKDLEVPAGTKVTWTNTGKILHNVVSAKARAKVKFGTKALTRGKSYSYKFKKPGKYVYYCSFHGSPSGGQRGTITVVPATPPTTVAPPTTAPPAG